MERPDKDASQPMLLTQDVRLAHLVAKLISSPIELAMSVVVVEVVATLQDGPAQCLSPGSGDGTF